MRAITYTRNGDADVLREVLRETENPGDAVHQLVDRANAGGGADNVTCVVADVA